MPTYEYECTKCGHHFELFQKIGSPAKKSCPKCKGKVRKLISGGAGLIFKGNGFYATDYKKSDKKDTNSCSKSTCPKDCPKNKD